MAQENPEKFPTGDTAARDEEAELPVWNIPSEFEDMPPPESRLRTSEEDENCAAFGACMRKNATELGSNNSLQCGGASGGGDGGNESHGADGLDVCILPPNEQILETIVRENHFVTKGVKEMDAGERRFCYYYWYMTNVYFITGYGNTRDVPPCLEKAIRDLHPSPDGVYVGYKNQAARLTRNKSNPYRSNNYLRPSIITF